MALRSLATLFGSGASTATAQADVGSWACPAELRARWTETDSDGTSLADRVLARLAEGGAERESLLDLRGANLVDRDLSGLDLSGADLRGADLTRAVLERTRLFQARLSGAILNGARLDDADLTGADLHGASLENASARRTGFGRAVLNGVQAIGANLEQAVLSGSECLKADFRGADLGRARIHEANLAGADFSRARLEAAELTGSRVAEACFDGCDLRHAEIRGLIGYELASWIGVDLRDVDFSGAYMTRRFMMDQNYIEEFKTRDRLHHSIYLIWWATSDCGRSLLRWSLCTVAWTILFTGLYSIAAIDYGDHQTWFSPLYFSVVTVTTLGYGDALPTTVGAQLLVVIQVTVGYMMLGGLISIMSNKLARRAE